MKEEFPSPPQGASAGDIVKVATKLSNWKNYVIYALLAVMVVEGVVILWQRGTVAEAKLDVQKKEKEVAALKVERDIAKSNESSCRINLDKQNTDIADAGKRYNDLQKEFDQLQRDIDSGKYYKNADDVKKQPVPKTCQETLDFFNRNYP